MSFKVRPVKNFTSLFRTGELSSGSSAKFWKDIPGPTSLPVIQQTHHYLPGGSLYNIHGFDLWNKLYENYGPITTMKIVFKDPAVVLLDAECVCKIARGENWTPIRDGLDSLAYHRNEYRTKQSVSVGVGLEQGEAWKKYRSMINQYLLQPKAAEAYRGAFEEVAEDMLKRLKSLRDDQNKMPGNLSKDFGLWTLECVSHVCFGQRLNFLDLYLAKDSPQMKFYDSLMRMFHYMGELDFKPSIWKIFPTKAFKQAMAAYDDRDRWSNHIIQQFVEAYKTHKPIEGQEKTVLEKLAGLDVKFAEVLVSGLLTGGNEAVPTAMNGILYYLATNTEKQNILRDSLNSNTDNKRYLKACIKESLRILPISNFVRRQTTKPYNLLGYKIPAGTVMMLCNSFLSKLDKHFVQPEKYIPERWIVDADDPLSHKKAHPYAYNPFGYGARTCLGSRVVNLQMETLIEQIIKNFRVEWNGPPPAIKSSVTIVIEDPVRFTFKDV